MTSRNGSAARKLRHAVECSSAGILSFCAEAPLRECREIFQRRSSSYQTVLSRPVSNWKDEVLTAARSRRIPFSSRAFFKLSITNLGGEAVGAPIERFIGLLPFAFQKLFDILLFYFELLHIYHFQL